MNAFIMIMVLGFATVGHAEVIGCGLGDPNVDLSTALLLIEPNLKNDIVKFTFKEPMKIDGNDQYGEIKGIKIAANAVSENPRLVKTFTISGMLVWDTYIQVYIKSRILYGLKVTGSLRDEDFTITCSPKPIEEVSLQRESDDLLFDEDQNSLGEV